MTRVAYIAERMRAINCASVIEHSPLGPKCILVVIENSRITLGSQCLSSLRQSIFDFKLAIADFMCFDSEPATADSDICRFYVKFYVF